MSFPFAAATLASGERILINVAQVETLQPMKKAFPAEVGETSTQVRFSSGVLFFVKESPEQLLNSAAHAVEAAWGIGS